MEVWLLETVYDDEEHFLEIFWHVPDTDVWITDTGYSRETLKNAEFTQTFWNELGDTCMFTRLGEI